MTDILNILHTSTNLQSLRTNGFNFKERNLNNILIVSTPSRNQYRHLGILDYTASHKRNVKFKNSYMNAMNQSKSLTNCVRNSSLLLSSKQQQGKHL